VAGLRKVGTYKCEICGKTFQRLTQPGRSPTLCSEACKRERARRLTRIWVTANPERLAFYRKARTVQVKVLKCVVCGSDFKRPKQAGRVPQVCSEACAKERKARGIRGPARSVTPEVVACIVCGAQFSRVPKPGRPQELCSAACRAELANRRAKAWYRENQDRVKERRRERVAELRRYNREYYQANRESEIQGSLAYARGPGRDAKRATDAARFALTRGAPNAERFTLDEIYERDNAVCSLCGEHVVRNQATMDHIVPVTRGGPHTRANVALAHRSCNTRKSNRV